MEFTNCDICDKNQATHEIAWGGVRCDECREKFESSLRITYRCGTCDKPIKTGCYCSDECANAQ